MNRYLVWSLSLLSVMIVSVSGIPKVLAVVAVEEATESAAEATSSSESQDEIKNSIKDRIKDAVGKETESVKPKALVGTVESLTDQSIMVEISNQTELVSVTELTELVNQDEESIKLEDLAIDSNIVIIVTAQASAKISAQKIILLDENIEPISAMSEIGSISIADYDEKTFEVFTKPNLTKRVLDYSKNTIFTNGENFDVILNDEDFSEGDSVLLIFKNGEDEELVLEHMHLISKAATESATISEE